MCDPQKFASLKEACEALPTQAAPLLHAFSDLTAAQGWANLAVQIVSTSDSCSPRFAVLRGNPTPSGPERIVYPMSLHQPTSFQKLYNIFPSIGSTSTKVLLGIVSSDSSIVYYELSQGIVSPKEVPD